MPHQELAAARGISGRTAPTAEAIDEANITSLFDAKVRIERDADGYLHAILGDREPKIARRSAVVIPATRSTVRWRRTFDQVGVQQVTA
jgi:hypothetical protein